MPSDQEESRRDRDGAAEDARTQFMDSVHLFYSWQSDRAGKLCRDFIWNALGQAAPLVQAQTGVELLLDRDTVGVAGTPPVTDTILAKIRACDIFLGDMSFVGQAEGDTGKLLPNPNVMAEYGFARAIKDHAQLQLVMNTAFGSPTELPFDMRHMRFPTTYNAPPGISDGARRTARTKLGEDLVPFLVSSVKEVLVARRAKAPDDKVARATAVIGDIDALTHRGDSPAIVSNPRLRVRLVPLATLDEPDLDPLVVKQLRPSFVPAGFANDRRQDHTDGWQWASFDPPRGIAGKPNSESRWLVRLVKPGAFEAAVTIGSWTDDDPTIVVRGHQLEARIVAAVQELGALAAAVGLGGPAVVAVALHGVEDVQVAGSRSTGRRIGYPDVTLGTLSLADAQVLQPIVLKQMLDQLWLMSGWDEGSPSFGGGQWAGQDGGEPYQL